MDNLQLQNLSFKRQGFFLELSVTFPKGSKTILVGANGAGKSTLLLLITGFLKPQSGKIFWEEREISTSPPQSRPFSLLFQDHNLFPHLTVWQNMALGIKPSLKLSPIEKDRLEDMFQKVGVSHLKEKVPHDLSGGERQRVALGRTLLRNTPLLLLDEPLGPLGPRARKEMLALLTQICDEFGLTLILTTHQPEEAIGLADHMVFLEKGKIVDQGDPGYLLKTPTHEALKAYLG